MAAEDAGAASARRCALRCGRREHLVALVALVALAAPARSPAQSAADVLAITTLQQDLVSRLAGHRGGPERGGLGPRSTPVERQAAAAFLADALADLGLTPRRHDYRLPNVNGLVDLLFPPYRGTNIYTIVEATSPSTAMVVVGAHYDSEPGSPGAGDNAAGVALVYALADRLSRLPSRGVSFLLVFFDQEEDDEVGSRAFARHLRREGYDVHSVHVTDLAGWDDDGDGVVEVQSPGPDLERRYREAAERLGVDLRVTEGASSDNKSFLAAGFRTVGVFGDITRHLHRRTDTYETVDFVFLSTMTALIFEVLTDLRDEGAPDAR